MNSRYTYLAILLMVLSGAAQRAFSQTPAVVNPVFRSELRPWMSLDGEWSFALDPKEVGEREKWFFQENPFSGTIWVPGEWSAQGVGEAGPSTQKVPLRHQYVGSAWYRKVFRVPPSWKGKHVWLKIGAVNSQGWFWLNGEPIGQLNTFCGSYKFNLSAARTSADHKTPVLKDGKNVLVARISNRVPSRKGAQNSWHQFGGIYRSVELEATSAVQIEDVWAQPDFDHKGTFVLTRLRSPWPVPNPDHYQLRIKVFTLDGQPAGEGKATITRNSWIVRSGENLWSISGSTGTEVNVPIALDPFRAWSPGSPFLYKAEVTLIEEGREIDSWIERFGVRKLERRGSDLYLNGKRCFLRGFCDLPMYPITMSSPPSLEEHKKHLRLARSYGFNYVRLHTHVEIPEYFQAADEVGMLIQPELQVYEENPPNPLTDLNELIRHYRRYTALATYSYGNEGLFDEEVREPLYRLAKLLDPFRLVVHGDGMDTNYEGIADLRNIMEIGWPYGDGKVKAPLVTADRVQGTMPVVVHEFINVTSAPDPRLGKMFTGAMAPPYDLDEEKSRVKRMGLSWELAERVIEGSHRLQSIYQKLGLEEARAIPELDGYGYWAITDSTSEGNQGLLTMFWQPKESQPEFFRQFNGETVLLLPGFSPAGDDRVYTSGDKFSREIVCSNYAPESIENATVSWTLTAGGSVRARGQLGTSTIPQGNVIPLGRIQLTMPTFSRPLRATLHAEIEGRGVQNEWEFYVFPERWSRTRLVRASGSDAVREKLRVAYPTLVAVRAKPRRDDLLVTLRLDNHALNYLESGGKVLLLSLADWSPVQPGMRPGWFWVNNQRGTALATIPAFGDFPIEGGLPSFAIFRIFQDAAPLKGQLQNRVEPLMVTLGKSDQAEPEDPNNWREYVKIKGVYSMSVFQARVGEGKLLASGLDLLSGKPEADYLLDQFLKYVQSAQFAPQKQMPSFEPKGN